MSFTSNEKSYGGYSSFSPMRHADRLAEKKERNKNVPAYVHDKVEEIMDNQKEKDEGKAWAVAWSIYCKYKKPNSPHCQKETDDYFPGRKKKKASWSQDELRNIRKTTLKVAKALNVIVGEGLLEINDIVNEQGLTEREKQIFYYLWTHGKFPSFLVRRGFEAKVLGRIAGSVHYESKPQDVLYSEERNAYKALAKVVKYAQVVWGSKAWARIFFLSGSVPLPTLRLEMVNLANHVQHGAEYTRLIRHLFSES